MKKPHYFIKCISNTSIRNEINKNYLLTENLVNSLRRKKILVTSLSYSTNSVSKNKLELKLFYQTQKLRYYRLKCRRKNKKTKIESKKKFKNITKLFGNKNVNVKIINLNKNLSKNRTISLLYKRFRYMSNNIFQKRTGLFCDFLKMMALASRKKVDIWAILNLFNLVFKPLRKRKHAAFLSFIKDVFVFLIKIKKTAIKGVKFSAAGRLKGKPRANVAKFSYGKIPLTKENNNVESAQRHVYTIYGCFGFKLWINYK